MKKGNGKNVNYRWAITIMIWSFVLSMGFRFGSDTALSGVNLPVGFVILFIIILIGIVFDILGIATATAEEEPFHGMAAKRVPGAKRSIALIRNADKVSSFCNDVIGDICGIISGSITAVIIVRLPLEGIALTITTLAITGAVAAITIGGKALGKGVAMNNANKILMFVGKFIYIFKKD